MRPFSKPAKNPQPLNKNLFSCLSMEEQRLPPLKRIDKAEWEISKDYKQGMKVPARIFATEKILKDLGYTVLSAASPLKALDLAKAYGDEIHLLITDMVLPEMNGKDLAQHIQSVYPEIKVLFMSGYTANVIAHHNVLEPGLCFLQKPFSVKDLAVKAREALENTKDPE